jgi:hypothetical protein
MVRRIMRQYAAALEGVNRTRSNIGAERTKPGSFNALCAFYNRSSEFQGSHGHRGVKPNAGAAQQVPLLPRPLMQRIPGQRQRNPCPISTKTASICRITACRERYRGRANCA